MRRQVFLLTVCGFLSFFGVGCGAAVDDPAPRTDEQASEESQSEAGAPNEDSLGDQSSDGEVEAFARNCKTTCTAVRLGTGEACAPVIGYGHTTVFGGCKKACRFARQNAEANAAADSCRLTGCTDHCQ